MFVYQSRIDIDLGWLHTLVDWDDGDSKLPIVYTQLYTYHAIDDTGT